MRCSITSSFWTMLGLFTSIGVGHASVLGTAFLGGGPIVFQPGATSVFIELAIGPSDPGFCFGATPSLSCTDIFARTISAADLGLTFRVDAATNPNFPTIAAFLTNHVNDQLQLGIDFNGTTPGGALAGSEQSIFFPAGGGPDFAGHTVTGLIITLTSIEFKPGPPFAGPSTKIDFMYRVQVEGPAVPEPGSASLFILGTLGIGFVTTNRRRLETNKRGSRPRTPQFHPSE